MKVKVNLVSRDQPLIERLKYYFKKREDIHLLYSGTPMARENSDIYIAPVHLIEEMIEEIIVENQQNTKSLPVIFYGSASFLRKAFLAGCADYLKDPWTVEELDIRLAKILNEIKKIYNFPWGSLSFIDTDIMTNKGRCTLTYQEYKILRALIRQRGKAVPREVLFYLLWNCPGSRQSRIIDVHISSIRRKLLHVIPEDYNKEVIISIKGIGYMIK